MSKTLHMVYFGFFSEANIRRNDMCREDGNRESCGILLHGLTHSRLRGISNLRQLALQRISFYRLTNYSDVSPAAAPCGICRQVLSSSYNLSHVRIREFAPTVPIFMFTPNGEYDVMTLEQLMPRSFGPEQLPSPEELSK